MDCLVSIWISGSGAKKLGWARYGFRNHNLQAALDLLDEMSSPGA